MEITLIEGNFTATDSINLVSQMIESKIKFHENKIEAGSEEEDIKFREAKIVHLQNELRKLKETINDNKKSLSLYSTIQIN